MSPRMSSPMDDLLYLNSAGHCAIMFWIDGELLANKTKKNLNWYILRFFTFHIKSQTRTIQTPAKTKLKNILDKKLAGRY